MPRQSERWFNWDQLPESDDFWDLVEELDALRQGELREQQQMEDLRRIHSRRLAARTISPPDGRWEDNPAANKMVANRMRAV